MTSQTPTWLTFAVGIAGLVGTLLAAIITQALSGRREKKQFKRQAEQDLKRWEREKADRREQWAREDAARWVREKHDAYAKLLASIESWIPIARSEKPFFLVGRRQISPEGSAKLKNATDEIDKALEAVELLAPEPVRAKARTVYVSASFFEVSYSETSLSLRKIAPPDDEVQKEVDEHLNTIVSRLLELRAAMRLDLGIEESSEANATALREVLRNSGAGEAGS